MMQIGSYTEAYILDYVEKVLKENGGQESSNRFQSFRKRSEHCWRVMRWCFEIVENEKITDIDLEELLISALFHDIGYNSFGIPHEEYGVFLFEEFAHVHSLNQNLVERVKYNIAHHSNKGSTIPGNVSLNLQILMEADLLDEEGTMGVVADCISEGLKGDFCDGYRGAYDRISKFAAEILDFSPMVTPYAAKCWKEKQDEVRAIICSLKKSFFIED